ncbi:hypothetical protein EDB84DRAFT_1198912 [Lactarius hengduanensis]|nr:hypothetical protein EDB84DRAFT_1198912 [Lactarius hengduanensis]
MTFSAFRVVRFPTGRFVLWCHFTYQKISQSHREKEMSVRTQGESYPTTISTLPTMSCWKYLISIEMVTTTPEALCGNGSHLCTYVKTGDRLYLRHHSVSTPNSLHTQNSCQERSGYLAGLSYYRRPRRPIKPESNDEANVIAALGHPDRVCFIALDMTDSQLGKVVTLMQEPFLVLTHLRISWGWGSWGRECTGPLDRLLGRICATLTGNHHIRHSLSSIANSSFVSHWPRQASSFQYTPEWLHFTRGDGRFFGHIAQARNPCRYIPFSHLPP